MIIIIIINITISASSLLIRKFTSTRKKVGMTEKTNLQVKRTGLYYLPNQKPYSQEKHK